MRDNCTSNVVQFKIHRPDTHTHTPHHVLYLDHYSGHEVIMRDHVVVVAGRLK